MSEANLPSHDPDSSNATDTPQTNWFVGWDDFAAEADEPADEPGLDALAFVEPSNDVMAVPDPVSAEVEPVQLAQDEPAIARTEAPAAWVEHATPQASVDLPAWHAEATTSTEEVPNIADLISLIQELNQCNNALLDRVSQLEDALEQTAQAQPTLMSLMGDDERTAQMQQMAQDLEETRSHATQLFEQLDAAHQSSKRQQILTETLSEQLQNSQERVAQLERECALTQQKYNEQAQLLAQSETARRDLTARLHRQQRYTLQFKAALEKCLEVSPSSLTTILEAIEAQPHSDTEQGGSAGLPKVQRIRPWSSQSDSQFLGKMSDIIGYIDNADDQEAVQPLLDDESTTVDMSPEPLSEESDKPVLHLPAGLNPSAAVKSASSESTVSYTLKGDRAIEPSAPMLPMTDPVQAGLGLSPEMIKAGVEELQAALNDLWGGQQPAELPQGAEAALWDDLARLIDVSSDDLLKATLANDLPSATEALDLEVLESSNQSTQETMSSETAIVPFGDTPDRTRTAQPSPEVEHSKDASPFLANPSWPSPLVHPLRRPRKLPSLAAVELPRFAN